MPTSKESIIRERTANLINFKIKTGANCTPEALEEELVHDIQDAISIANQAGGVKIKQVDRLSPASIADLEAGLFPGRLRKINLSGELNNSQCVIGMYQESGQDEGIYSTDENKLRALFRRYCYTMTEKEYNSIIARLNEILPTTYPTMDRDLIAVNNGIFDYSTKKLLAFSQDYVFTAKSRVNYNPNAQNITIHNDEDGSDWDVESWMNELSDDPEVVKVFWQVLGAILRPNVNWDKSVWLYSETGNNGKGTLCELMRQLCGEGSYASIPLVDMGKDFMLEPLVGVTSIIVDENDVGTYIDKAANLKTLITGDVLTINRKFQKPIALRFHGMMVQCLNEMPRIKDKTNSLYRRQLFIAMTKCFTGMERKYIKHDYLHRPEVLEYVMNKVLNTNYYELDTPQACVDALDEYKEFNDPVLQFVREILPELKWSLAPFGFLYDLYRAWYKKNFSGEQFISKQSFVKDLLADLKDVPGWTCPDKKKPWRPQGKMDVAEPLIAEYQLTDWINPQYVSSKDIDKKCLPALKATYKGIVRV